MVDEPMAILAAMKWLDQKPEFSMFTFLHRDIGKHTLRRNGFEAYLVFHLREAFKTALKLNEVFTFRKKEVPPSIWNLLGNSKGSSL